jgi:CTP synthase
VRVVPVHSEVLIDADLQERLGNFHGILVAPGFGERGIEGKIKAIQFVRENNIPFFGICLGMQCAVVEFARNVLGLENAASTEMNLNTPHPVINMMETQKEITHLGGTMRLGSYPCEIKEKTRTAAAYKSKTISERHRHRYEFNNDYLQQFEQSDLRPVGVNPETNLVEIIEHKNHPWFIGVQFHPELKSTVEKPHPLFVGFVKAAMKFKQNLKDD